MDVHPPVDIGTDFLGYRVEELIGRGGMGVVYRAYDLRLKRSVAVKFVAPSLALDERFRERFARETELVMSLEHPNVVPIYDAGDVAGRLYLAMRLVEGPDLGSLLRAEGALEPARTVAICAQIASALDAAHARGLVHRDVKPSNVLLDGSEHVYLADFGLTRSLGNPIAESGQERSIGTPAYLAPEQLEGLAVDGSADVYSVGCLLYECLTGERVFPRDSRLAEAWAHLEEEPPRASDRRPELPKATDAVIRKAMAKQPEDRYTTCSALVGAAEDALELRPPLLLRHWRAVVAAGATLLATAGALVAVVLINGTGNAGGALPAVTADSLVRIDPKTNKVDKVVRVGGELSASAVGGRSVWVYNAAGPSVSSFDAATGTLLHTTKLPAALSEFPGSPLKPAPRDFTMGGPALAADAAGVWLVGVDPHGRSYLMRVFSGPRDPRKYRLHGEPRAVAVGFHAVWIIIRSAHGSQLQRRDPANGKVTKRIRFAKSEPIDGLAVGFGYVWVVASSTATLYRIDPRSSHVKAKDLGGWRAARPEVVLGEIWVAVSVRTGRCTPSCGSTGFADDTNRISPRTMLPLSPLSGAPGRHYDTGGYGSIWDWDTSRGIVVRWDGETYQPLHEIRVTEAPSYVGACLTSLAVGDGAVWVTVVANDGLNVNNGCPR